MSMTSAKARPAQSMAGPVPGNDIFRADQETPAEGQPQGQERSCWAYLIMKSSEKQSPRRKRDERRKHEFKGITGICKGYPAFVSMSCI